MLTCSLALMVRLPLHARLSLYVFCAALIALVLTSRLAAALVAVACVVAVAYYATRLRVGYVYDGALAEPSQDGVLLLSRPDEGDVRVYVFSQPPSH